MTATLRIKLRRPADVAVVEDLSAVPTVFDDLFPRVYYAHQMRLAGYDWPTVARRMNYSNRYAAEKAVRNWLYETREHRAAEGFANTKAEMHADAVQGELERLDALQSAYWEEAIGGHIKSAEFILKVINQRSRLLGLEVLPEVSANVNTLIVGGTEDQYVAALLKARDLMNQLGPATAARVIESE
jgi:hypothetical protein